jgi:hypothetical protein
MSSFISEGKNVFDAVEKAITIACNPPSFSVKVLKRGVESFFWWKKKPTVILFSYTVESKDKSVSIKRSVVDAEINTNKRKRENLTSRKNIAPSQSSEHNVKEKSSLSRGGNKTSVEDVIPLMKEFLLEVNNVARIVDDVRLVDMALSSDNVLTIRFDEHFSSCENVLKENVFSSLTTLMYEFIRYTPLLKKNSIEKIIIK